MKKAAYPNYLLGVLLIILAFNNVDSLALGLVLQGIKIELDLSDTQLGFLTGFAFALFYSVMGIPLARWADRGNRVTVIALTAAVWSLMVALCGLAKSFSQLLLIRVGVAVGEAGCTPPAYSLIADYFTRAERPRAVSIYLLGGPLSGVIGYWLAGWLNQLYGWRMMFIIIGFPGLVLAALAWFTLKEPRRGEPATQVVRGDESDSPSRYGTRELGISQPSLKDVFVTLWANRTLRHLLFSFSVMYFFGYGIVQWLPAFIIRSYGVKTGELGTWFAMIYGFGGILGTFGGGELASRCAARNERLQLKATAVAYSSLGIIFAFIYLSTDYHIALALIALSAVGGTMASGPLFAMIQTLVPQRMRAVSIAIIYFFANLIGAGLGPLAVGALSDLFRQWAGEESLRYALLTLCPGYFWSGWHLWYASRTVARDLQNVSGGPDLTVQTLKSASGDLPCP